MGETLQLARERKGVDLYRAERDTKIRLHYLAALEDGDWDELPAPVYTKGFLRNQQYAVALALVQCECRRGIFLSLRLLPRSGR